MKDGWRLQSLGEIAQIKGGKRVPKGCSLCPKPNGFPYIRVTDINDRGSLDMENLLYLNEDIYEQMNRYAVSQDDLFISIAGTIGKAGMIPPDMQHAILTENACKLVFEPGIDPRYIYYFTQSCAFQTLVEQRTRVTAVPKLALFRLATIPVPLPESLAEQQHIVTVLDEAFWRMELARQNLQKNLANVDELFNSLLNSIFTSPGEGWEQKRLGDEDLLEIIAGDRGRNYPKRQDYRPHGYCLFLNAGNIHTCGFDFKQTNFITRHKDQMLGRGKLQPNDVVMTTRGIIGNVALYNDKVGFEHVRVNSGILILRPNLDRITPGFLVCLLLSEDVKTQIRQHASGATQPQLSKRSLADFIVPVPRSLDEQQRIVDRLISYIHEIRKMEALYHQKLDELEELKQSILQRAFSGEL